MKLDFFLTIFARVLAQLQQGVLAGNTDFFHIDNKKKRSQRELYNNT
jgi:hypothetical protein